MIPDYGLCRPTLTKFIRVSIGRSGQEAQTLIKLAADMFGIGADEVCKGEGMELAAIHIHRASMRRELLEKL